MLKIRIQKASEGLYSAELFTLPSDPPRSKPEWTTPIPMSPHDLAAELLARGVPGNDIGDAFEEADPDLSPKQREHVPTNGEEVLVTNHLGIFRVEDIDADAKTASLRVLRSGALMKDVEWSTIWPFDDEARQLFKQIRAGGSPDSELLMKYLFARK